MAAVPAGGPGTLVEEVKAASVTIRLAVKTRLSKRDDVARQLRAGVERALEQAGIPLPPVAESLLVAPAQTAPASRSEPASSGGPRRPPP